MLNWLIDVLAMMLFSLEGGQNATNPVSKMLFGLLECCGGGAILRDLLLLHRAPTILQNPMMLYVCAYISLFDINLSLLPFTVPLIDTLGTIVFIANGSLGDALILRILCGFVSGIGGGLQRSIYRGRIKHIRDIFTKNRILALIFSILFNIGAAIPGKIIILLLFILTNNQIRSILIRKWNHAVLVSMLPQRFSICITLVMIDISTPLRIVR